MSQLGRKKGANGERSRALLLHIAAEEFAQKGYHATKISTIVEKASLTQPTFYLYFKSKEAIFQELVNLFQDKLFEITSESRLAAGILELELPKQIELKLNALFRFFKENEHLSRIGFYLSEDAGKRKEELVMLIEKNLLGEVEDGYFRTNIEMRMIADALVGVIERLTITKLWTNSKTPEELSKEIVQLFLYGIHDYAKINKTS